MPGDTEPPTVTILLNQGTGPISSDPPVDRGGCLQRAVTGDDGETRLVPTYALADAANSWIRDTYGKNFDLTQAEAENVYTFGPIGAPTTMTVIARDNGPMNTMTVGFYIDLPALDTGEPQFTAEIVPIAPDGPRPRYISNTTRIYPGEFYGSRGYTSERYPDTYETLMFGYETHPSYFTEEGEPIPIDGLVLSLENIEHLESQPTFFVSAVDAAGNRTQLEPILISRDFCQFTPSG